MPQRQPARPERLLQRGEGVPEGLGGDIPATLSPFELDQVRRAVSEIARVGKTIRAAAVLLGVTRHALQRRIYPRFPGAIAPLLDLTRKPIPAREANTAVFYSISNCQ